MSISVAHGVPIYSDVAYHAFVSMTDFYATWRELFAGTPVDKLFRIPVKTQPVFAARTMIAEAARDAKVDILVMQDSDVSVEPDGIAQLVLLLETLRNTDRPAAVVGAPCVIQAARGAVDHNVWPLRDADGQPTGVRSDAPFECAAVGFGLVAIDMRVFDFLPAPWFSWDHDKSVGEDVGFCDRVRNNWKRTVWCEPRVRPTHTFRRSFTFGDDDRTLAAMLAGEHERTD